MKIKINEYRNKVKYVSMKYRKSGRDVWNFIKKIEEVGHLQISKKRNDF